MMTANLSMVSIRILMWHTVYSKLMPLRSIGSFVNLISPNFLAFFYRKFFWPFSSREFESRSNRYQCHGAIVNKNKIEDFKSCDKLQLVNEEGKLIWSDITSGACLEKPSLLSRFFIFAFGVSFNFTFLNPSLHLPNIDSLHSRFHLISRIWKHSITITILHIRAHRHQFSRKPMNQNPLPMCSIQFNWMPWPKPIFHYLANNGHFSSSQRMPATNSIILNFPIKLAQQIKAQILPMLI